MKEQQTPAPERRSAFATLVTEHSRAMYRAARALLPCDADAEDAVGEAVLLAWQSFPRLRDPKAARAWLVKITINCARAQHRRTGRVTCLEDLEGVAGEYHDPAPTLWDAVCRLPEEQRSVVTLFYYEDWTVAQIARQLHVPQGTVKSRLSRAREKLRTMLGEEESL